MSQSELPSGYSNRFLQVFEEVAKGRGFTILRWLENGAVLEDAAGEEMQTFFTNIYRRCQDFPPDDWPDVLEHFIEQIHIEEKPPDSLGAVVGQLRARVGQQFAGATGTFQPWFQPLGETGLVLNLVVDYPGRMLYVTEEMLKKSDEAADYWIEIALQRLAEDTPAQWCQVLDEETGIYVACLGDSYDAARALVLDRLLPDTKDQGCFVAPLGRDVMFFLPVSIEVVEHIHLLKVLAEENYDDAPYPITSEVYWVHKNEWMHFPIEIGETSVQVYPPIEMLRYLGWVEETDLDDLDDLDDDDDDDLE